MTLPKLLLSPTIQGYGYSPQNEVISIQLDGGSPRKRRDKIGAYGSVNCNFILSSTQYRYFMAFYRTKIKSGALPFRMDIKTDDAELLEHECFIKDDSVKLTSARGDLFFLSLNLEVKPIARNETEDILLIDLYEFYGDNTDEMIVLLSELVNETLPSEL
jgi:hypothetical protein